MKGAELLAVVDGEKVRAMREAMALDVKGFSKRARISEGTLRKIERGKHRAAAETVWKIADVFGVEAQELARPASVSRAGLTVIVGGRRTNIAGVA
jgi:predicted transcriptional regulator